MEAYTGFASVYDKFMKDIPYSRWAELIREKLIQNGILPGASQIVELGCGTGAFTIELAKAGYNMIGIDNSEEMLTEANSVLYDFYDISGCENADGGLNILYSFQDMTCFEIPYEADGIVSVCDSMNYLIEDNSLLECFRSSWNVLRHKGVLIFDMKKKDFYREELADNTFADCMEDCAYIWNNYYDEASCINEYDLTIFIGCGGGKYERCDEYHRQRAYAKDEVVRMLLEAGFTDIETFEINDEEDCRRMYFAAVKP